MNEQTASTAEGSPAVEEAEQRVLGTQNYQKAEVVHQFASTHPWVHPVLIIGIVLIIAGITWLIKSRYDGSTHTN